MKIKLDENIPRQVAAVLLDLGYDADTVPDEGLAGSTDDLVWRSAQQTGRLLITQDLDFSDISSFAPGTHAGIILLRMRSNGRVAISRRLKLVFESEDVSSWSGSFIVITDRKIRIRRA
jgi:predicted nuclease of predicted toxin-antitoxin system